MREMQAESPRLREEVLSAQGLQESIKKAEIAVFGRRKAMVQVGDQFKIEIEDVFENEAGEFLYKIKGFRSLVFDEEGILKLTPLSSAIEVTVDCAGNLIRKGDEVIVLGDLGDAYDPHYCFMDEMKRFVGKQFAVSEVYVTPCGEKQVKLYNIRNYKSDIVNGLSDYIWVGKWLMKVEQP